MDITNDLKALFPLFIFFIIINIFCFVFSGFLDAKGLDHLVLAMANCLLFFISVIIFFMHKRSLKNPNPNVFIRSVMAGTIIKLFAIAGAIIIYFLAAGENKSIYAVIAALGMYIIYTFIEVKTATGLNKKYGRR